MLGNFHLLLAVPFVIALASCSSLPQLSQKNTECLSEETHHSGAFIATGSGVTLEQAKDNLRADLASQISSDVSVNAESTVSDVNGKVNRSDKRRLKVNSNNIPIDQYRVTETCSNGKTFFVRGSLAHDSLVSSVRARLTDNDLGIQTLLDKHRNSAPYDRYLAQENLTEWVAKARLYSTLLDRYSPTSNNKKNRFWMHKGNRFLQKNQHLKIRLTASASLSSMLPVIGDALKKSRLSYSQTEKRPVIKIRFSEKSTNNKKNGRYFNHLTAKLDVRRADSNELLATLELGKFNGQSSISRAKAKDISLRKLQKSLKTTLGRHQAKLRKKLGL